jgi:diguanylate cyclase (GGDEF)-like protein/PAS domain S-box-containing protein
MEKYFFCPKSSMAWARTTTSLVRNNDNEPQFVIQMIEDITERKRARLKQRIATKVFETTTDGIMITNAEGRIIDVNQSFLLSTGYSYNEVLDKNPRFLKSGHYETGFYTHIWETTRETGRWCGEICNQRKNGESYNVWLSMSAVRGEHHEIVYYVAVYSDISALHPDDERMRLLTHYDTLTELPNRLLFHEYMSRSCHQDEKFAVLYLDLEDFKSVNELLGFDAGDECLREVAKRLHNCLSEGDHLSRLESDEFMILLGNVHQDYDIRLLAEKIFMSLATPIVSNGHALQLDCNIGISLYPNQNCEDKTPDERVGILLQQADVALFLAKEAGKNAYHIFSDITLSA